MIPKSKPKVLYEDVHGVGPVGGTFPLNENDGRRPTRRAIERATGRIITIDDQTDPDLYEELPGGAP